MAIESQGVVIKWNNVAIAQVISIGGPTGSAPVIDISHLGSTGAEKLMGLLDEGQVTLEVNWIPDDAAQVALRADRLSRTQRVAKIYLTDTSGTILTCDAYCTGMVVNAAVNQQLKGTITLEVDGNVNHSPRLIIHTAYNEGTGILVLDLAEDVFAAALNSEDTDNWTFDYDGSGLVISTISRDSDTQATLTYTTGGGIIGTYTMTVQAEALALVGSFDSGILQVPVSITS